MAKVIHFYDSMMEPLVLDNDLIRLSLKEKKSNTGAKSTSDESEQLDVENEEVLQISYKKLKRLNNLHGFDNLKRLQLDNNSIEKIENLSHLVHLERLDLSFNKIKKIEGLEKLTQLIDLSLYRNDISVLEGMDTLENLTVFSIGNNKLFELDKLIYLRRFTNLSVVTLMGNPVCNITEYRNYVLARIRNIKYLDHKLVDENTLKVAREQYHDELRELMAKQEEDEQNESKLKEKETRLNVLREANLQDFDTLFEDIIREDTEMPKLRHLRVLNDILSEYGERFTDLNSNFITQMLENHQLKKKETEQFKAACEKIQLANDQRCQKHIDEYNSYTKKALKDARSPDSYPEAEKKLESIRKGATTLYDQLFDLEMQLVEQLEEFIREFEAKMAELTGLNCEVIRNLYLQYERETETAFHEKMLIAALQEMGKFNKNELEYEPTEEEKTMYSDKEALTNLVNSSLDLQSLQLESREDDVTKYEQRWAELSVNKVKNGEHKRNSDRVAEIISLKNYHLSQITLKE